MSRIIIHNITKTNLEKYFLAQHVEWQWEGGNLVLYNTLFDSVVITNPKSIEAGKTFVRDLEIGCENVLSLIKETYEQSPEAVYSLLVNKKIIE